MISGWLAGNCSCSLFPRPVSMEMENRELHTYVCMYNGCTCCRCSQVYSKIQWGGTVCSGIQNFKCKCSLYKGVDMIPVHVSSFAGVDKVVNDLDITRMRRNAGNPEH